MHARLAFFVQKMAGQGHQIILAGRHRFGQHHLGVQVVAGEFLDIETLAEMLAIQAAHRRQHGDLAAGKLHLSGAPLRRQSRHRLEMRAGRIFRGCGQTRGCLLLARYLDRIEGPAHAGFHQRLALRMHQYREVVKFAIAAADLECPLQDLEGIKIIGQELTGIEGFGKLRRVERAQAIDARGGGARLHCYFSGSRGDRPVAESMEGGVAAFVMKAKFVIAFCRQFKE